jgi:hypothetical protein
MERPQVADAGDGLQIWRAAANTIEYAVADSRQEVFLQLGGWAWGQQLLIIKIR